MTVEIYKISTELFWNKGEDRDMKVITVTFHRAENYGAVLQCFALQKVLQKMGCESEVLDLGQERQMYAPIFSNIRYIHRKVIFNFQRWCDRKVLFTRKNRFHAFINKNLLLTQHYSSVQELYQNAPEADAFITGSDQVWNPEMYPELVPLYQLDFVKEGCWKYSYAASFGKFVPDEKSDIWNKLQTYTKVSVREQSALEMMKQHGIEARIDIDPVFFLEKKEWEAVACDIRNVYQLPNRFILVFELIPRQDMEAVVEQLRKEYDIEKVVVISLSDKVEYYGDFCVRDAGPGELLGLIREASVVVSTSYHGAMLSLIMEKEIYALPAAARERYDNIFGLLDLDTRVVGLNEKVTIGDRIEYEKVNCALDNFRTQSAEYLKGIVNHE